MDERTDGWTNKWMHEWLNVCTGGGMKKWWITGRTDGWMMDDCRDCSVDGLLSGGIVEWMDA